MRFATLWLDHGKGMNNGTYSYAILPGRTTDQVKAYAAKPSIDLESNTPSAQVVKDPTNGFTGIVGWIAGEAAKVSFSDPLLILIHEQAGKLSLALSEPTMKLTGPITIKFPHTVKSVTAPNGRIKVVSQSPLALEFDPIGTNGQSQRVEFAK